MDVVVFTVVIGAQLVTVAAQLECDGLAAGERVIDAHVLRAARLPAHRVLGRFIVTDGMVIVKFTLLMSFTVALWRSSRGYAPAL